MPHVVPKLTEHGGRSSTHRFGYPADRLTALDTRKDFLTLAH